MSNENNKWAYSFHPERAGEAGSRHISTRKEILQGVRGQTERAVIE